MAGSQANLARRAGHAVGLAVLLIALGVTAPAQSLRLPSPAPSDAAIVAPADLPYARPGPATVPRTGHEPGPGSAPTAARVETGVCDTIAESICGKPDPNTWRPLPLSTLFSEGWSEIWVPSPRGSGGAPRQGWINAVAGNLYRGWFFTFAYGANNPPNGNAYLGSYTLMTPLSRRMMLITNVPFVLRNNVVTGLPIENPNQQTMPPSRGQTGFGDISFTPRVLLHETKDFSLTAELSVLTPTGAQPLAGRAALTPAFGFWNNFADGWVIRGGLGDLIKTQGKGGNTLIGQLAIGQTLTDHDVPLFGDFTYYVSAVVNTPLSHGDHTSVTLTPGLRTHLGSDWYLLAGLPTPLTKARVADLGMILWFAKAW